MIVRKNKISIKLNLSTIIFQAKLQNKIRSFMYSFTVMYKRNIHFNASSKVSGFINEIFYIMLAENLGHFDLVLNDPLFLTKQKLKQLY